MRIDWSERSERREVFGIGTLPYTPEWVLAQAAGKRDPQLEATLEIGDVVALNFTRSTAGTRIAYKGMRAIGGVATMPSGSRGAASPGG